MQLDRDAQYSKQSFCMEKFTTKSAKSSQHHKTPINGSGEVITAKKNLGCNFKRSGMDNKKKVKIIWMKSDGRT